MITARKVFTVFLSLVFLGGAMTERSMYWGGTTLGDATIAPYDDDEFTDNYRLMFQQDRTAQGVILTDNASYSGLLEVTNPAGVTIRVATGAALVDGKVYTTDAVIDFTGVVPGAGSNYYTVVLRKSWAAQTVRAALLGPNVVAPPAVTQTDGVTWELSLATVQITNLGVVTVTDTRQRANRYVIVDPGNNATIADPLNGNGRATSAVDLQTSRTADTQVASGNQSTIGGGDRNTADMTGATVSGGVLNNASDNWAAIGGGAGHTIDNGSSYGTIAGGDTNTLDGADRGAIGGGAQNEIDSTGDYATIPGGYYANADKYGQVVAASGRFAATGDAQGSIQMVARLSVAHPGGAAWQSLYLNGSTQRITVPADSVMTFSILLAGTTQGGGAGMDVASYEIVGTIENDNGTTTLLASTVTELQDDTATCQAQVVADDPNDALIIQVEDTNAVTRRWVATIRTVEASFP